MNETSNKTAVHLNFSCPIQLPLFTVLSEFSAILLPPFLPKYLFQHIDPQ